MRATFAVLISIAICATAAALEGVYAGKNVRAFFAKAASITYSSCSHRLHDA
jgi:hypothetical protein